MSIYSLILLVIAGLALTFLIIGCVGTCKFNYKMEEFYGNLGGFMIIVLIFGFFLGGIAYTEHLENVIVKCEQLSKHLIITNNSNSLMVYNVKVETVFKSGIDTIILKPNETKEFRIPEGGFKVISECKVDSKLSI